MTRRPQDPARSQFLWRNRSRDPPVALLTKKRSNRSAPDPRRRGLGLSRADDRQAWSSRRLPAFCRRSGSSLTSISSLPMHRLRVGGALAGAIGVHETFDRGVQFIPRSVDEIVVAHRKPRADEEFLT